MSRAAVYSLLSTDPELAALGVKFHGFQAVDTPSERPFATIRWGTEDPGARRDRGAQGLTIWVYDRPASFIRIDAVIRRIKEVLLDATHVPGDDGLTLTQARWVSDSQDMFDDIYGCLLRTTSFDVLSRAS